MVLLAQSERNINKNFRNAFTFVEILVVFAIVGIMSTIGYYSMSNLQTNTDTRTSLDRLIASIKTQRVYAMLGNSSTHLKAMPQGVYFESGSNVFVLFSCDELKDCSYMPNNNSNIEDSLEKTLVFSTISLPGNQIIFSPISGEVANFQPNSNTIMIDNIIDRSTTSLYITSLGTVAISP